MRTGLTGHVLRTVAVVCLAMGVASAQDRGAGGGAQAGGRGGRGGGGLAMLTVTSTSFADGAEIPAKYHVQGFPTLLIIDQKGVLREIHTGYSPTLKEKVVETIDKLLQDPASSVEQK